LRHDLESLGLREGDTVLVRADVGAVGRVEGGLGPGVLGALIDAVGSTGTIVSLSFTKTFLLLGLDKDYVFNATTPTTSGALPRLLLQQQGSIRSRHPTNSFVALGPKAAFIVAGHDETAPCFLPMAKLLELDARQLVFGCVDTSPGFTTAHWAQHELGLDRRSLLCNRVGVLYERDGDVRLFRRQEIGGCSLGFGRFYSEYEQANLLRRGHVGRAAALSVDAAPAFSLERSILARDPRFALCRDPLCVFCRGSWTYNKRDMPGFGLRFALYQLRRLLRGEGIQLRTGSGS
jgi:aminoglycoside N3'-acetyltransferase